MIHSSKLVDKVKLIKVVVIIGRDGDDFHDFLENLNVLLKNVLPDFICIDVHFHELRDDWF